MIYKVELNHIKDFVFTAFSEGRQLTIDAKAKDGLTPPGLLLASLASCMGTYAQKYAEGAKIDLGNFAISIEAQFSEERPVSFRKINCHLDLKGVCLGERRQKSLLEFVKNCPVHNSLKGSPEVEVSILC